MKNKKILLFDYTNLVKRCLFSPHIKTSNTEWNSQLWEFQIWESIYFAINKHKADKVILCSDNSSWRKLIYPPYKINRKFSREKNINDGKEDINWDEFYLKLNNYSKELKENLPFYYINEKNCEADDIIGFFCEYLDESNKIIIVSSDSDYIQLTNKKHIKQYDPMKRKFVESIKDREFWLNSMALKGQLKDNIYNILTPLDFPLEENILNSKGIRKPTFTDKMFQNVLKIGIEKWLKEDGLNEINEKNKKLKKENKILLETNLYERFKLNKKILDLYSIPQTLKNRLKTKFEEYTLPNIDDFYPYFKQKKWRQPLEEYTKVEETLFKLY